MSKKSTSFVESGKVNVKENKLEHSPWWDISER